MGPALHTSDEGKSADRPVCGMRNASWHKKRITTSFHFLRDSESENVQSLPSLGDCRLVPHSGCYIIIFNSFFLKFVSIKFKPDRGTI